MDIVTLQIKHADHLENVKMVITGYTTTVASITTMKKASEKSRKLFDQWSKFN